MTEKVTPQNQTLEIQSMSDVVLCIVYRVTQSPDLFPHLNSLNRWFRERTLQRLEGLMPHQRKHMLQLCMALYRYDRAIDTSVMGCGKSYTASAAAARLGLPMVVFCPKSAKLNWMAAFEHFGISGRCEVHAYSAFAKKEPPFLYVLNPDAPMRDRRTTVNESWRERCSAGLLLVLDEAHQLKNASKRHAYALKLTDELRLHTRSKLLLLSATPYERTEHAPRLARILGLYGDEQLAQMNPATGRLEFLGLAEIERFCQRIEPGFHIRHPLKGDAKEFSQRAVHWCFQKVLRSALSFSMRRPDPASLPPPPRMLRLWYDAPLTTYYDSKRNTGLANISMGRALLAQRRIPEGQACLCRGMHELEIGKIPAFVASARALLESDTQCKVILMLSFIEPIQDCAGQLAEFNPLVIHGKVGDEARHTRRTLFQAASAEHRLLIGNMSVLSNGVDLDDQDGRFPRHMLISPSYDALNLHQVAGRVYRSATRSPATIYHVMLQGTDEGALLANLRKKDEVLTQATGSDFQLAFEDLRFSQLL